MYLQMLAACRFQGEEVILKRISWKSIHYSATWEENAFCALHTHVPYSITKAFVYLANIVFHSYFINRYCSSIPNALLFIVFIPRLRLQHKKAHKMIPWIIWARCEYLLGVLLQRPWMQPRQRVQRVSCGGLTWRGTTHNRRTSAHRGSPLYQ